MTADSPFSKSMVRSMMDPGFLPRGAVIVPEGGLTVPRTIPKYSRRISRLLTMEERMLPLIGCLAIMVRPDVL